MLNSTLVARLEQELHHWNATVEANPTNAKAYVRRGMARFKLAQIQESIQDFDQAEQLQPSLTPYLWQRGLAYYYADRFEEGAKQFEIDLTVNGQDLEETVWRYLCIARSQGGEVATRSLLPMRPDPRPFMRLVYDLYAGTCSPMEVLNQAAKEGTRGKFYSHLYVGLYSEVWQAESQAREHIAIAAERYPQDDYMWNLAIVHQHLRGWTQT
ncbi:MAG: hypothetical protein IGS48_00800 [Oscillatoriales cyanobacterium C42_A2020_001]|nr:hypothetical protein [Leptolyngbyaceae cyanobacterium C42_A2020_001]